MVNVGLAAASAAFGVAVGVAVTVAVVVTVTVSALWVWDVGAATLVDVESEESARPTIKMAAEIGSERPRPNIRALRVLSDGIDGFALIPTEKGAGH
ncbi:hypothetical protein [Streptomyces flaveus]|uniref:hypothetical protein n=1 Tax=Streptomyces flaveus TaxID=66370 RepID=UPI001670CD82|nr:hypothetical protein [Streptomyces flaveus]